MKKYNINYVAPYEIRFKYILAFIFIAFCAGLFFCRIVGEFLTHKPVVLNENYKGKYIQVKTYHFLNKDSTILYYNKPLDTVMVITGVCPEERHFHVKYDSNSHVNNFRVVYGKNSKVKYKKGDKVAVTIKFYPEVGIVLKK